MKKIIIIVICALVLIAFTYCAYHAKVEANRKAKRIYESVRGDS